MASMESDLVERLASLIRPHGGTLDIAERVVKWLISEELLRDLRCPRCFGAGMAPGDIDGRCCGICGGTGLKQA
jgi:hypothetical protein